MKCITFIFVIANISLASAQDVLINSSKIAATPEQQNSNTSFKIDSLSFTGVNQAFFESIKKTSKEADKPIVVSDQNSNTKLKEKSIEVNKKLKEQIEDNIDKINRYKNEKKELEKKNAELKLRENLVSLLAARKDEFIKRINKDKNDVEKLISELRSTKDSLNRLRKLILESQSTVKNSLYQITSIYSLYDTAFTRDTKKTIIKSLSPLAAQYTMSDESLKDLIQDIKNSTKEIDVAIERSLGRDTLLSEYYEKAYNLLNSTIVTSTSALQSAERNSDILSNELDNFYLKDVAVWVQKSRNNFKDYAKNFIEIKVEFNAAIKKYDELYKEYFEDKKTEKETEFGAFPNISYLIGDQRSLNLNISVLGAYTKIDEDAFSRFEAKLFTSSIPKSLINAKSLFITEISSFGAQMKYVTGYEISAKKRNKNTEEKNTVKQTISNFGGTFELNFLSKQLSSGLSSLTATTPSSSTSVGLSNFIIHAKGGGELVVLRDVFSIYSNLNWITLIDNSENFHREFANLDRIINKSSWVFFDVGCKLLLNPMGGDTKKVVGDGFKIVADFNLIIPRIWGRQLINGVNDISRSDMFLPVIRLGVRKSLGIIR